MREDSLKNENKMLMLKHQKKKLVEGERKFEFEKLLSLWMNAADILENKRYEFNDSLV